MTKGAQTRWRRQVRGGRCVTRAKTAYAITTLYGPWSVEASTMAIFAPSSSLRRSGDGDTPETGWLFHDGRSAPGVLREEEGEVGREGRRVLRPGGHQASVSPLEDAIEARCQRLPAPSRR